MAPNLDKFKKNREETKKQQEIAAALESNRTKRLLTARNQIAADLRSLTGEATDNELLKASWMFKFFLPGIYAAMVGATEKTKNASGEIKLKELQAKKIKLKSLKVILDVSKAGAALTDAVDKLVKWCLAWSETVVIPILLIIFSIIIIPLIALRQFFYPSKMSLAGQIQKKIKQVNKILQILDEKLKKMKKEVILRRQLSQINQLLAAKRMNAILPPSPAQKTA